MIYLGLIIVLALKYWALLFGYSGPKPISIGYK
jgi:hypothetical protein